MKTLLLFLVSKLIFVNVFRYACASSLLPSPPYEVLHAWKSLDYKFPSLKLRNVSLQTGEFIPQNNILVGIKMHGSRIFLTVPRLRAGVPSTLNYIDLNDNTRSPPLIPYPSWTMQQVGNCSAFQFVQSMEVDRWGRMWVIDAGRDNLLSLRERVSSNCPAKLVIIDLATDKILHTHEFPASVVNPATNYLNDIVVECKSGRGTCWAYITDPWEAQLVIYSLEEDRSWFVKHAASMEADAQGSTFNVSGSSYNFSVGINGIALSPRRRSNHDRLYYSPLSSFSLYSVLTSTLKDAFNRRRTYLADADIKTHAKHRPSQSSGLMTDASGLLFTGQVANNAVSYFDTTTTDTINTGRGGNKNRKGCVFKEEAVLIQDNVDLQWPDTFAFDDTQGYLYLTSCRMHRFFVGNTLDFNEENFKIVRVYLGLKSYMY